MHILLLLTLVVLPPSERLGQLLGVCLSDVVFLKLGEKILDFPKDFKFLLGDVPLFEIRVVWILVFQRKIEHKLS